MSGPGRMARTLDLTKAVAQKGLAWPTAEFAPTGPGQIVQAIFHKDLAKAKEEGRYEEAYEGFLELLGCRIDEVVRPPMKCQMHSILMPIYSQVGQQRYTGGALTWGNARNDYLNNRIEETDHGNG